MHVLRLFVSLLNFSFLLLGIGDDNLYLFFLFPLEFSFDSLNKMSMQSFHVFEAISKKKKKRKERRKERKKERNC